MTNAVTYDSGKDLFGGDSFSWGWSEGGTAGTSTSFKLTTSSSHATLINPITDTTQTDITVIILNVETSMYTLG